MSITLNLQATGKSLPVSFFPWCLGHRKVQSFRKQNISTPSPKWTKDISLSLGLANVAANQLLRAPPSRPSYPSSWTITRPEPGLLPEVTHMHKHRGPESASQEGVMMASALGGSGTGTLEFLTKGPIWYLKVCCSSMVLKISYQHPHPMPLSQLQFQLKGIHITLFWPSRSFSHTHCRCTNTYTKNKNK